MNKPLSIFGGALAAFGGLIILIDMLVPHTQEGTVKIGTLMTGPVGWCIMALGAALFLLAVDSRVVPAVLSIIPIVGPKLAGVFKAPSQAPTPVAAQAQPEVVVPAPTKPEEKPNAGT